MNPKFYSTILRAMDFPYIFEREMHPVKLNKGCREGPGGLWCCIQLLVYRETHCLYT